MIDAHHHYWLVDAQEHTWRGEEHTALARDFTPADLATALVRADVDRTVLVESADLPGENDRLATYADRTPTVAGTVAWLPVFDPDAAYAELNRAATTSWVGVRCLVGREPLPWLADPDVHELFRALAGRGLAWDVVPVVDAQVDAVIDLAARLPELRIVVDHLCRPPLTATSFEPWAVRVSRLADLPNVAMKLSVGIDALTAWRGWEPSELRPYVAHAVDAFGTDRLMLASNWPVVLLRATYEQAVGGMVEVLRDVGVDGPGLAAATTGTAARWYRLPH